MTNKELLETLERMRKRSVEMQGVCLDLVSDVEGFKITLSHLFAILEGSKPTEKPTNEL
jgi:hypothetical protein